VHEVDRQLSGLPGFLTVFAHYRYLSKNLEEGDRVQATRVSARSVLTHYAIKREREEEREMAIHGGRTRERENEERWKNVQRDAMKPTLRN